MRHASRRSIGKDGAEDERYDVIGHEHDELRQLRSGNEDAFAALVDRYGGAMLRVARVYVADDAAAEEVVQDAWLAVLNGIERFGGRSSLRSWVFAILINQAKSRGVRDARVRPFSYYMRDEVERQESSVSHDRFAGNEARWPGHWVEPPAPWTEDPEQRLLSHESLGTLREALDRLPPAQRTTVILRDVVGYSTEDVCNALGINETNVRVLLHRGRSKLRQALENYMTSDWGESA